MSLHRTLKLRAATGAKASIASMLEVDEKVKAEAQERETRESNAATVIDQRQKEADLKFMIILYLFLESVLILIKHRGIPANFLERII